MSRSSAPLLTATKVRKRYGGILAVDDVSFDVWPGEVLGLVGPNGAGKTTLVDVITGAQSADAGALTLAGRPLEGKPFHRAAQGMARTFQHPQLAMDLTVHENLVMGKVATRHRTLGSLILGVARGMFSPRADSEGPLGDRLASELGLVDLDRLAGDLTLGEQRLVEVGRALGADPQILLLDEPFAGADSGGIAGISRGIEVLRERGHAVLLVDHNVDLVAKLVDRILLLDQGRVAFDGSPASCLGSEEMQKVYFGEPIPVAEEAQ